MSADLPAGMTVNFDKGGKSVKVKDLDTTTPLIYIIQHY